MGSDKDVPIRDGSANGFLCRDDQCFGTVDFGKNLARLSAPSLSRSTPEERFHEDLNAA